MEGRFQPGDHLRVWRRPGYYHHGIYVSDGRVIQFGSGVTLAGKGSVGVTAIPLGDFEQGGTAAVVRHGYESWFTGHHPAADEPWKIIARAEYMLKLQPRLPYNLIGHNCEHVANLCVSQYWGESYQTRRFFGARAAMDMAFLIWLSRRSRANLPVPPLDAPCRRRRGRRQPRRDLHLQRPDQAVLAGDRGRLAGPRAHARGGPAQRTGRVTRSADPGMEEAPDHGDQLRCLGDLLPAARVGEPGREELPTAVELARSAPAPRQSRTMRVSSGASSTSPTAEKGRAARMCC